MSRTSMAYLRRLLAMATPTMNRKKSGSECPVFCSRQRTTHCFGISLATQTNDFKTTRLRAIHCVQSRTRTVASGTLWKTEQLDKAVTECAAAPVLREERHTEPGGRESVVRTTSAVDLGGHWQIQEQDVEETTSSDPDTKETKKTVLAMVGGTLTPVLKSEETERRSGDSVEVQRRLLTPDGGGRFQVFEERQTLLTPGKDGRNTEEKTYRKDYRGEMMVIEQTSTSEWQNGEEGSGKLARTYSTYVPGRASDGRLLHIVEERNMSANIARGGNNRTEEQVQQVNPGAPDDGLRTSSVVTEASENLGKLRTETHKEVRGLDGSGHFPIIWVTDSQQTREIR
jgi:hypothetical protein